MPKTIEERNEKNIILLLEKIEALTEVVSKQENTIDNLNYKIENLRWFDQPDDERAKPTLLVNSFDATNNK